MTHIYVPDFISKCGKENGLNYAIHGR